MQNVLVTGASGFVGGHVARRLAESMQVTCLVRNPGGKTALPLEHPQIRVVQGDLTDAASLARAVTGMDLVVHAATDTRFKDRAASWDVAVEGTRRLYQAAAAAGVRRFVFVSSAAVYAGAGGRSDEEAPLQPCGYLYCDEKIAAEQLLLASAGGPEVVILRPPSIYGPGSRRWSVAIWKAARKGKAMLPAGGQWPFAYIYIDNFVDAVAAALTAPSAGGVYNVLDGITTYAGYVQGYLTGMDVRTRRIPYGLLWLVAAGAEGLSRVTGRPAPLTRRMLQKLMRPSGAPTPRTRARQDLGWEPGIDLAEGMRRTRAWLEQNVR